VNPVVTLFAIVKGLGKCTVVLQWDCGVGVHKFSLSFERCVKSVAVAFPLIAVVACEEAVEAPVASQPRPVIFVEVASAADVEDRSFPARIAALQTVELGFRVPGQIAVIEVIEAQDIEQGDLIARDRKSVV